MDQLLIRKDGQDVSVLLHAVDWIESARNYIRLHTGEQMFTVRGTLEALEARLDARRFARIHRRLIVNLDRVAELQHRVGTEHVVILTDGQRLKLSRTYGRRLRRQLESDLRMPAPGGDALDRRTADNVIRG